MDLDKITPTNIKKACEDVSHHFTEKKVEKEIDVKTFYEEKTKKIYAKGDVWYELSKKEEVQSYKGLCLQEKNNLDDKSKKPIFGGDKIRNLLGLPESEDSIINPKNLKNFHLYVESTSDNRKLVRGTKALIRR